jgi:hypothetical protein
MGKLAQYRFLKKLREMLDTPVRNEDSYDVSAAPIYIGDKRWRSESDESNPSHSLRRTQVKEIVSMLLEQISRLEQMLRRGGGGDDDDIGNGSHNNAAIGNAFIDIAVALAELDAAILFTEAEKAAAVAAIARRQKLSSTLRSRLDLKPDSVGNCSETLTLLRLQIQDWQLESAQRQKKVKRVETTIRDLGLNVNDVRCAKILREQKDAVAASEAVTTAGATLCRETCGRLEAMILALA